MPARFEFGRVELTTETSPRPAGRPVGPDRPFRIGILGDFRGSGAAPRPPRAPVPVDRDTLDAVIARMGVGLRLALPGDDAGALDLAFRSLGDFHPDALVDVGPLRSLREALRRLADPATFPAAAEELGLLGAAGREPAPPSTPAPAPPAPAAGGEASLLDQIFQRSAAAPPTRAGDDAWTSYLREITGPQAVHRDVRQADVVAGVEARLGGLLRGVLHHPEFQALEAAWRGVDRLTRALETGRELTIELIDTNRAGLEADLLSPAPLESTASYRHLVEDTVGTEGGEPWGLLVALVTVEPTMRDVVLLWRLARLGRLAGAPVLAATSPRFVGCDDLVALPSPDEWGPAPEVEGWAEFRRSSEAPYAGLVLPRWLLRAPYGPGSDPVESFPFEERETPPRHEHYLWGHPGLAVAQTIGRAFNEAGWDWADRYEAELGGLPLAVEKDDGESTAKPCAETLLGERAVGRLLDAGLIPLVSVRHADAIRVAQVRSVAAAPTALAVRTG